MRFSTSTLLSLAAIASCVSGAPSVHKQQHGKHGAVASEAKPCTEAGISMLKKGGTAADAHVATVFCVGVIGMYHSGIGGGGFMLIHAPDGKYEYIDFREKAPAASTRNMYKENDTLSIYTGLASGVPGELRGNEYLHKKYGKLPWKEVMQPAIKLARDGFTVDEDLVRYMQSGIEDAPYNFLVQDKQFAIDFAPNGKLLKLGDTITRKRYAKTLETIAEKGVDEFYCGEMAKHTINAIQKNGGIMTMEDLKNYSVEIREPVSIDYGDYKLTSISAPSSGAVALSILNTISGYEDIGWKSHVKLNTFRLNEAMRWAYAQRAKLGDPSYIKGMAEYQSEMLTPERGDEIRSEITKNTHKVKYYNPKGLESLNTPGTSEIASADGAGLAISMTTTINLLFGSLVVVPETGIIMNNEMNDFSIPGSSNAFGYIPTPHNFVRPGKRPLSSISCTIATRKSDNSLAFVTGAAGGSRIISSTAQTLWHWLSGNATAHEAVKHPRIHDQLEPNTVYAETTFNNDTLSYLKQHGAKITYEEPGSSSVQAISRAEDGTFEAASEVRQKNSAGIVI